MRLENQQSGDVGNIELEKRILRSCSNYIEQKFRDGKRTAILPQKLEEITAELTKIKNKIPSRVDTKDLYGAIGTLESSCDAAISLYGEPQNRKYYFDHLKSIGPELQRVLRILDKYK